MRTRNISIQPELDDFVDALVKSGDFANYSEVIRWAVREARWRNQRRAGSLEANSLFVESVAQGNAGESVKFDPKAIANRH